MDVTEGTTLVRRGKEWRVDELGQAPDNSAQAWATGRGGEPTGPMRALLRPMWVQRAREWHPVDELRARGFKIKEDSQ